MSKFKSETPTIALKTVGYLSFETGKVYTRKSDRNRGEQRVQSKREQEQAEKQQQELTNALSKLKDKFSNR